MPIFRIATFRTETFTIETFVRAPAPEAAEEAFFAALEGEGSTLQWIEDYDGSNTEVEAIEDVTPHHAPQPTGKPPVCGLCGRSVRWTGVPAERSPGGRTIPGPWIHLPDLMAAEGIGL